MRRRPALAPHLLTALSLALSLPAAAQISPADLTAAEQRAQREAERVFSVIKFHSIRSKPAADAGASKPRPAAPRTERPAAAAPAVPAAAPTAMATATATAAATPAAEPGAPAAAIADAAAAPSPAAEPAPLPAAPLAAPSEAPTAAAAIAQAAPAEADDEGDDPDETPLRLQHFVAPVLTPALQATLGAGARNVRVRLTVRPDGSVSQAEAAAGVPRRLARPATDAILQWQFAPLPQTRTADVDIAFRSD